MVDSNVLNWFKQPSLIDDDNVLTVGGTIRLLSASKVFVEDSSSSLIDDDEFIIIRDDNPVRVTAEVLAAYIVAENTTTKEITFADSPYPVTALDDFINVDASGGNVVIDFLLLGTAPIKPIYVRKNAGGANTVTLTPDSPNTIDGSATLIISTDGNAEMCVPFSLEWRTF